MTPPTTLPQLLLHPSLDIKAGMALVGFRYRASVKHERVIYVLATHGYIHYVHDNIFSLGDQQYVVERGGRMLMPLAGRLHAEALWAFIEDYNSGRPVCLSPRGVFERVQALLTKYVELETAIDYAIVSAWAIGTYFFPLFAAYPFLHVKAPKGSGKSQLLMLLAELCHNAVKARPTFAALCDTVDALRGTYLIDQADTLTRWHHEELTDILTDSYKRGGGKRRLREQDNRGRWRTVERETYGPKVFASTKELPADLRDRCLVVPLIRSQQNFLAPDDEVEDWRALRGHLYALLLTEHTDVVNLYELRKREYRAASAITGRELELWLPLAVLLEWLGARDVLDAARARFAAQYQFAEYHLSAFDEELIKAVHSALLVQERLVLAPTDIVDLMDAMLFKVGLDAVQKGAMVGRAIRRLNLASAQATRSKHHVRYMFERAKVARVYTNYIHDDHEPPLSFTTGEQ
jgi:hypothetical protein